ncbi:hypothetical protein B0H13DRAFT_854430 [Mycena leptocephala]|nr:hypothetical protein B0H13DRAFT_854430 [Mycena leptocephala]
MDSATLVTGAAVVLTGSLAIYQFGKPKPLPLIPHNKLHWLKGDIPFLVKMEKENSGFSYLGLNLHEGRAVTLLARGMRKYVQFFAWVQSLRRRCIYVEYAPRACEKSFPRYTN